MKRIATLLVLMLSALSSVAAEKPEQVLIDADRAFAEAFAKDHVAGWTSYAAEEAVMLHPTPVVGKEAVKQFAQKEFADPNVKLEWDPTHAELFQSGTMGVTTGRWKMTNPTGKSATGDYVTIWRKQKDGSWKYVADGGTPDPAK